MQYKKIVGESFREVTRDRLYFALKPGFIANIAHFGRLRYSRANPGLQVHAHQGIMEICYLDGGEQVFCVDGREYLMRGGDVFVTFPGERHSTGAHPMEKSTLYWIGIELESRVKHFLGYAEPEAEHLRLQLKNLRPRIFKGGSVLRDIMEKAIGSYCSADPLRKIIFRNRITEFLLDICAYAHGNRAAGISSLFGDLLAYIDRHYQENLSVKALAAQVQLSMPQFKKRFKNEIGIAPNEYILRKKVDRAKEELVQEKRTVTQTALSLGFSSSQYFATVFKRFTGASPKQFGHLGQ